MRWFTHSNGCLAILYKLVEYLQNVPMNLIKQQQTRLTSQGRGRENGVVKYLALAILEAYRFE